MLPKTVPEIINQPIVNLEIIKLSKIKTHPNIFQEKFLNIQNNFIDYPSI